MKRLKKIVISLLLTTATISTQFLPVKNIEAKTIQSSSIVKNEQVNSAYVSKLKNLKVSAKSSNFISIKWDKVNNASGYMVYRANKSNGTYSKIATIKNKNTTYYKNSNLSSNKKYYYKVRAYKKNGSKTYYGSYSNVLSVSTTSKSKSYMTAYKTFLDKNKYLNGKKVEYFFTHDINNDGIKELVIVDKTERDVDVYTYINGSVKYCGYSYDRGVVYIDKANRLSRIFTNSAEYIKYNLTLNTYNKLSKTCYTYDRIDKKYYWSQGLIYANNFESEISKSEYDKAIKKYELARYITKYSNTSSNRSKYLK